MTARLKTILIVCLAAGLLLGAAGAVLAFDSPAIGWWVLSAGGRPSSGGQTTLNASIGQPIVGVSSAGNIGLKSGYWTELANQITLYLPVVQK
jgi:hypothetical protein